MRKLSLAMLPLILTGLAACGGGSSTTDVGSPSSSSISSSSISSTSSASSQSLNENWALVWSDEFEGESIDTNKWSFEVNCTGGGNNELQCYTPREENAYLDNGFLHIVAREESYQGPGEWDDSPSYDPNDTSVQRDYTSARLRTKGKGDFKYGRMEIRAKLPQGQGIWPAFWMLPTDNVYGGWPRSGEIDVLEAVNTNAAGGNEVHGTLHYGSAWPGNQYSGTSYVPPADVWQEFHTYAVEWSEGEIHWFVDDVHYATQTSDGWYTYYTSDSGAGYQLGEGAAPFDQNFHLIVNLAVGGNWPQDPDDTTSFPQTLLVDYVRVYQCALDPETGAGCSDLLDSQIERLPGFPAPDIKSFSLYRDGDTTLTLETPSSDTLRSLTPGYYESNAGNLVVDPAFNTGSDTVWSAEFSGAANIFLSADQSSEEDGLASGVNLSQFAQIGQIAFDLLVEEKSGDAQFLVKVDSGWPAVSQKEIEPSVGEWTRVVVRLSELQANNIEPGQVDLNSVVNPFVLELAAGTAKIKINNIAYECLGDCAPQAILAGQSSTIETPHTVFDDAINVNWDFGIGIYQTAANHVSTSIVEASDNARGQVIDVQFGNAGGSGIAFIQSTSPKDMSVFSGGRLVFDVQVLDYGLASQVAIRVDCVHPCSSGDIELGMVGSDGWQTVEVPINDLVNGGLDLSRVNTPLVISPTWEAQANVHLQLDNIRYIAP
ncbi:glycoside hydrolase family 16 protein [Gilvimarinus sp. 1_MG-2023]|uniref:glycoside hydrolase family 16 protein n=1 Tax=Gilvimarinus sp. 1_MG-2023 TaxID=3062638 RepID=UPI0026E194DA|nr:glycoside hydrolase family 16 protein [Gilvimarinus sp. 1_MG-2023]MDO6746630.1 family 16 glycosylhydrolase [Gilvimarinus sp. 1_MG-2023]